MHMLTFILCKTVEFHAQLAVLAKGKNLARKFWTRSSHVVMGLAIVDSISLFLYPLMRNGIGGVIASYISYAEIIPKRRN